MKYLLGSGFYSSPRNPGAAEFFPIWLANVRKLQPQPEKIVVISVGNSPCPASVIPDSMDWVELAGNCGHLHALIGKEEPAKSHELCGWSASVMTLAMMAYTAELDFVYQESDCLCFGPVIEQMCQDIGDAGMVFGAKMTGPPNMACAQSLFLVRHRFIPKFVGTYLSLGRDGEDGKQAQMTPESKFVAIERIIPKSCRRLSFGVDRQRPWPKSGPWYVQQLTAAELHAFKSEGLI